MIPNHVTALISEKFSKSWLEYSSCAILSKRVLHIYPLLQGENGQNEPENQQNWNMAKIAPISNKFMKYESWGTYYGKVWTIKVVLEFWFGLSKYHFFGLKGGHFWQKPNLVLVFKNPKQSKKSKKIQKPN